MMGITAIVVSKGLDGLLNLSLEMLSRALGQIGDTARHRIVVVDNASPTPYLQSDLDGSVDLLLRFDAPVSFAQANNEAVRAMPNDGYLLVNNDVLLTEAALAGPLHLIHQRTRAGLCGIRLVFPDGTIQHRGVVFGAGTVGPYQLDRGRPSTIIPREDSEWQAVSGACMLVVRRAWEEAGGLDEGYAFGLEDVDFCLRARQQGWRVFCSEALDSLHFESMTPGRSELDIPSRKRFMEIWRGRYCIDG